MGINIQGPESCCWVDLRLILHSIFLFLVKGKKLNKVIMVENEFFFFNVHKAILIVRVRFLCYSWSSSTLAFMELYQFTAAGNLIHDSVS